MAADLHVRRAAYQVLVNGYTGKMEGSYPISPWKVLSAILFALIVLMMFLYLQNN